MKLIKQFTCLVACFVILCSSFVVSAEEEYLFTIDDLIDMGAYENENGAYVLTEDIFVQPYLLTEPNYPQFDINRINWSTMPGHIQEIVYSNLDDLNCSYTDTSAHVPFVMIRVNSDSYFTIFAGYNVCIARNNSTSGSFYLSSIRYNSYLDGEKVCSKPGWFDNACLFSAQFRISDYSQTSDWSMISPTRFDSCTLYDEEENLFRTTIYNYLWLGSFGSVMDLYFYGANLADNDPNTTSISFKANEGSSTMNVYLHKNGFYGGRYISSAASYNSVYCNNFTPKTLEQYQQQLQQEQNSLLNEGNQLQQEQIDKLDDILNATGDSTLTTLPDEALNEFNDAESDLIDEYNPDDLDDDLDIELDSSALDFIWLLFDGVVTADNAVFTLFISILSIGIIALILGR